MSSTANARTEHRVLLEVLTQMGPTVWRVLDLEREYAPLTKQLACLAAGRRPNRRGAVWKLEARLEESGPAPCLRLLARLEDGQPAAEIAVPARNLGRLGRQMALQARMSPPYTLRVSMPREGDPALREWDRLDADEDIEVADDGPRLRLPSGFAEGPPAAKRRALRDTGSWLTCVFGREAWARFMDAARRETQCERAWAARTRMHLAPGRCWCVIDSLVEVPAAESGRAFIVTRGRDTYDLYRRLQSVGAYLHLHPPTVTDRAGGYEVALSAAPSPADELLAWNLEAMTDIPVLLPIALFGGGDAGSGQRFGAYGYEDGALREISLEVLE